MKWFKKLSTVILIILANYFDFVLGRRACCAHFCITDNLEKSNEMITFCIDFVRDFYDQKNAASAPPQPPNAHLFCGSDNAASQAKNNYHFSWMIDYVEEDHGLQTVQQNFTAEQHGKGTFLLPFYSHTSLSTVLLHSTFNFCVLIRSMGCRRWWRENGCRTCSVAWL